MPAGSATIAMPNIDDTIVTRRPRVETGYISPYPTVVNETVAQYIASKNEPNESGSTLNTIIADMRIYPIASAPTENKEFLEERRTPPIIINVFE